jgi:branched-subunit amino acid transport protein
MFLYIAVMAGVTYLIRMIPFTLFRKKIKSRFIQSVLYYIPYAVLSAMTFPAILSSTENMLGGAAAFLVAVGLALKGKSLLVVSLGSSAAVLATEFLLTFIF